MKRKLYVLVVFYIFISFFAGTVNGNQRDLQDIKVVQDVKMIKGIRVIDDNRSTIVNTSKRTIAQLLSEQNILINQNDVVNLRLDHELIDGMVLEIKRAKEVSLTIDGEEMRILTAKETVKDLISEYFDIHEKNYNLKVIHKDDSMINNLKVAHKDNLIINDSEIIHEDDSITDGLKIVYESNPIVDDLEIVLNSVVEFERSVIETIPFEKEERYTDELFVGETKVIHQGVNGKLEKIYIDTYVSNSKEKELLIETNVLELPANEIVEIGTKPIPKTINGLVYSKEFDMVATAYTSYKKGGSYTYTGVLARVGIVAVDPRVIPLGSKLYIEGYGEAIAGDTGGVIKGNKVDLYMNSVREAINYGIRKVKVYLLES